MFIYFLLLFTVIPAIELILIIEIGSHIGSFNTLMVILFTGVAEASLARWQGFLVIQKIQSAVNKGSMPNDEILDGLFIFIGGIVLLTPGFLTDFMGLICLIPFTRHILKSLIRRYFDRMMKQGKSVHIIRSQPQKGYDDIDI